MSVEIEAKFLQQNHVSIRQKLQTLGAVCEHPMSIMHRTVFDFPDRRLQKEGAWVRLREELNGSIELTLKRTKHMDLTGTHETVVGVNNYEDAKNFVISLGLEIKGEQESKREVWRLDETEIMLDEWPWVQTFIEIEAPTQGAVRTMAKQLGLDWSQATFGGVTPVYLAEYDLTKEQFESLDLSMRFGDPTPQSLQKRTTKSS